MLGAATALVGGAFLVCPHAMAKRLSGDHHTPGNLIVRVLGGRQLLQGATQFAQPKADVMLGGIIVDLLHAGSMLAASVLWPAYRRAALSSAGIATVSAGAGALVLVTDR
jgi:hypothetical protein